MNENDLRKQFSQLHTSMRNGEHAPHKPLLLLWAIGRCLRGEKRMASYGDTAEAFQRLMTLFAPDRKTIRPEHPFGHLRYDNLWQIHGTDGPISDNPGADLRVSFLRQQNAHGGFPLEIYSILGNNRRFAIEIVHLLIDKYLPNVSRDKIMRAVGIEPEHEIVRRWPRNSRFFVMVLSIVTRLVRPRT